MNKHEYINQIIHDDLPMSHPCRGELDILAELHPRSL